MADLLVAGTASESDFIAIALGYWVGDLEVASGFNGGLFGGLAGPRFVIASELSLWPLSVCNRSADIEGNHLQNMSCDLRLRLAVSTTEWGILAWRLDVVEQALAG